MSAEDPCVDPAGPTTGAAASEAPSMRSLLEGAKALIADVQGALQERLALLGLELRLAAKALGRLLALAVACVLLLCTAWALLVSGLYVALILAGLGPLAAIGLLLVLNLGGAALAAWFAWRCVERLTLPATVRRLRESPLHGGPADDPPDRATPAAG